MCRSLAALLFVGCLAAAGCSRGNESLESFRQSWHEAVNARDAARLYAMLDAASQRKVRAQLEELRGLPPEVQKRVVAQLGAEKLDSLASLTPERYFAALWHRATEGQRPTMQIEAEGNESASMRLSLGGERTQRVMLVVEAGRWAWTLPEQRLDRPVTAPGTGSSAAATRATDGAAATRP